MFGDIGAATRNGFKHMVKARQIQAQSYVNGALLSLDDATLSDMGYSREELIKRPHNSAFPF